ETHPMIPPPTDSQETMSAPPVPPAVPHTGDPQATQDFPPGTRHVPASAPVIPGYDILSVLGHGGMGVVYKARQRGLNRLVALKMILAGGFASEQARMRFLLEGEVLARLRHPHIVHIYDVGMQEHQPYFVMECVEGGSLAHMLLRQKTFAPPVAATLIEQL